VELIAAHQSKFLNFLSARVEDRAVAEDILQSAYLKAMEHGSDIRDDESTVAWFYRILRNAITDHYRRRAARTRAHESFAAEAPVSYEAELRRTACACIGDVIRDLKGEYRTAIEQVDLGGATVEAYAQSTAPGAESSRKETRDGLWRVCRAQVSRLHLPAKPTVRLRLFMRQQQYKNEETICAAALNRTKT
jgi:RNA polymerase sigma-70 factor (ECF subfamily)